MRRAAAGGGSWLVGPGEAEADAANGVDVARGVESSCASALTCTSSVFVEPNQFTSQTSSISRSRGTTVPASCISSASRSNSLRASSTGRAVEVTLRRAGSSRTPPISIGPRRAPRPRCGAAQHGADSGDHLPGAERLDDVVVGAELEPDDTVRLLPARRDDDDRHARRGAQLAAHVEPGAVGQHRCRAGRGRAGAAGRARSPRRPSARSRRGSRPARAPRRAAS